MNKGVISRGISTPFIKSGDNIIGIVVDAVLDTMSITNPDGSVTYDINDRDIIGVTESVVAMALNQYVTVDDIAADIENKYGKDASIVLIAPIYSKNRFSIILKGIARAAKKLVFYLPEFDEVGNPRGINHFTGVNIMKYYAGICFSENCECIMDGREWKNRKYPILDCRLHSKQFPKPTKMVYWHLDEICSNMSPDWGLLGSNKVTEEKLKLFPSVTSSNKICKIIKKSIRRKTGKDVIVCIYGDGCFKNPIGGVWEFADPITMPGYTDRELIESASKEIKLKEFIDKGMSEEEIQGLINEKKSISLYRTTPKTHRDILASLMNLTSGSGDRATPIVLIQNYFRN